MNADDIRLYKWIRIWNKWDFTYSNQSLSDVSLRQKCCTFSDPMYLYSEPQEEEAGLKMLPSAFLSDLEVGNKTFVGMSGLKKGQDIQ